MPWIPADPPTAQKWQPSAAVAQTLTGVGIPSAEAMGTAAITTGSVTVTGVGIPSAEAVGTATITTGAVTLTGVGIPSAEALGDATLKQVTYVYGLSIPSAEVMGSAVVTPGSVTVTGLGIASGEAVGDATITTGAVTVVGIGIPSAEAMGVAHLSVPIFGVGIPSEEAMGDASVASVAGSHVYTNFGLAALTGLVDLSSDSIKAIPLSAYTVGTTRDTATFIADVLAVATEASGGSYVSGGVLLSGVTITEVGHSYVLTCDPITFSSTDIPVSHVLFADAAGGSDATDRVILFWALPGTQMIAGANPDPDGLLIALAT